MKYTELREELREYYFNHADRISLEFNDACCKVLDEKYHEAFEKKIGIYGSSYTNTMMVELGVKLHFAAGSDKNIKLTTKDDLELFKAYLRIE